MITNTQLAAIINNEARANKVIVDLNNCLNHYQIITPLEICHFLAQVLHESGCFRYNEEIASGEAYEGRKDLGNTFTGDGIRFKGRGYIQITGRANYSLISKDFNFDFLTHPEELSKSPYAMLCAGWYWDKRVLNKLAAKDDIVSITKKVNGGLNGLKDRQFWLNKCKTIII